MKFRIIEVPSFDNWSGEYEITFSAQQKVWFWWKNIYTGLSSLKTAEIMLERFIKRQTAHKNKPYTKVHKEIEV
jgi:hypothetical protein